MRVSKKTVVSLFELGGNQNPSRNLTLPRSLAFAEPTDKNGDGVPDYLQSNKTDTDGDGLPDDVEKALGTDSNKAAKPIDTDGDGKSDALTTMMTATAS